MTDTAELKYKVGDKVLWCYDDLTTPGAWPGFGIIRDVREGYRKPYFIQLQVCEEPFWTTADRVRDFANF